jgi:Pentapeptide repeats (9 copies)
MTKLRSKNFWEPTYEPLRAPISQQCLWSTIPEMVGPFEKICKGEDFSSAGSFQSHSLEEKTFKSIDFEGDFKRTRQFTFKKCCFEMCHFSGTTWTSVKFNGCVFKNCTFGVVTFSNCHFYDCIFERISITGVQTKFVKTVIDPALFVNSAFTNMNLEQLAQYNTTPDYQSMRLEQSKAKLAVNLSKMLKNIGDRDLFAKSIRTKILQNIKANRVAALYSIKTKNGIFSKIWNCTVYFFSFLESAFFTFVGNLNNWGTSFRRCVVSGGLIISFFSLLYFIQSHQISESIIKSTEITFLAGFTKYTTTQISIHSQLFMTFNMLVGVMWYGILVPTVLEYFNKDD